MRKALSLLPYRGLIMATAWTNPPRLFDRLHRLPWYGGLLRTWARESLSEVPSSLDGLPRVAEIGCGPGRLACDLAHLGYRVHGLDRSPRMLAWANRHAAPLADVSFAHGAFPDLPLAEHAMDAALAASVLNCVPDPAQAVREMARIVRPGGVVAVLVPVHLRLSASEAQAELTVWADEQQLSGYSRAALVQWLSVARRLALEEVEGWFTAAGLTDLRHQTFIAGRILSLRGRVGGQSKPPAGHRLRAAGGSGEGDRQAAQMAKG